MRDFLNTNFPSRWVGRRGPLQWASQSSDHTPCDFFLWGHIKSRAYATKPLNPLELEERIYVGCREVEKEMLQNFGEAYVGRWLKVVESGGV